MIIFIINFDFFNFPSPSFVQDWRMSEVVEMDYVINFDSLFVQQVGQAGLRIEGFFMKAMLILVMCTYYYYSTFFACVPGAYVYSCLF